MGVFVTKGGMKSPGSGRVKGTAQQDKPERSLKP